MLQDDSDRSLNRNMLSTFLKLTSKYWIGIIPVVFYRLTNRMRTRRLWYDMVDSL